MNTLDDERAVLLATKCGDKFSIGDMVEELAKQSPDLARQDPPQAKR